MVRRKIRGQTVAILVAVIALGLWGGRMKRQRDYCLQKSREHRSKLLLISGFHFQHPRMSDKDEERLRNTYPHAAWHLELSDAYLRCASRPWRMPPTESPEPSSFPPGQVSVD